MKSIASKITVFISLLGVLGACTQKAPQGNSVGNSDGIFSNRPIGAVNDLYIFTLKSPALLATAEVTPSGLKIAPDQKAQVLAEQTAFEQKLKAIAPDAQIVYRYRLTLNGLAVWVSSTFADQLQSIPGVTKIVHSQQFARPKEVRQAPGQPIEKVTSVNYIGASQANRLGFTGAGMRIGVIDTGVDYTHAMLGGSGNPDDYKSIDPSKPSPLFPNSKIVGGTDLVGSAFDAATILDIGRLPKPDANPLDEAGHGSHVAGTIAGVGDGINTYSGVAPDAKIYAIKVFGKAGSTADAVVIAGFEYAANPSGDLDPKDRLDVVNLSLGGSFGQPHVLYSEAVRNITRGGTVVVAAAGNSGATDYIVGDPSTSDQAISIAASVDGADINWKFPASVISSASNPKQIVRIYEGPISRPVAQSDGIQDELVDIGFGDKDLPDDVKAKLNGKVALIQRGNGVGFLLKLQHAKAGGAIGAVVYNNVPGDPTLMGGEGSVDIPAIMVTQEVGLNLIKDMATAPATVVFKTDQFMMQPQNVDTIAEFSSKGPRSEDNMFKPELSAPGRNITSAMMGSGNKGVVFDGTSMATPHVVGSIALIRQAHPELSAEQIKALVMNTTRVLSPGGKQIQFTFQGAGLVQIMSAIQAQVLSDTPALSLGRIQLEQKKTETRQVALTNLGDQDLTLTLESSADPGLSFTTPAQVKIAAHKSATVAIQVNYELLSPDALVAEVDGRIAFKNGDQTLLAIPAMAIRTVASEIQAVIGTAGAINLTNASPNPGIAVAFNLLGEDAKKGAPPANQAWMNSSCDLRSVGYRILHAMSTNGPVDTIQFAFNLYAPVTTWHLCDVSVLIDTDGDGIADQELAGVTGVPLEGFKSGFTTLLLDATKARGLRLAYEQSLASGAKDPKVDYTPAILAQSSMAPFEQSSLIVLEADVSQLAVAKDGKIHIKVAAQAETGQTFESDDYLGDGDGSWLAISPKVEDQPYYGMEEVTNVGATASVNVSKGAGLGKLVLYYPFNDVQTRDVGGLEQILTGP